jgi:guanine deaminase
MAGSMRALPSGRRPLRCGMQPFRAHAADGINACWRSECQRHGRKAWEQTDMTDEHFLRRAIALAERAVRDGIGQPFGAVVVRDGHILGEGCNLVPSTLDPSAHAEIVALRAACQALGRTTLGGGTIYASCEPCAMCLAAIHLARIERLVFASSAEEAAAFGFDARYLHERLCGPPDATTLAVSRLLIDEGRAALALGAGHAPGARS